jgi:hypothetical protein
VNLNDRIALELGRKEMRALIAEARVEALTAELAEAQKPKPKPKRRSS